MSLILAIESDRRQAARITAIARDRLNVELIVAESAERALEALIALAGRTPDLILTPQLMSPKDETSLNERLRELDAAGLHVQTLTIPVLGSSGRHMAKKDGLLSRFRRGKNEEPPAEDGCDPAVFAAQITEYLDRAAEERAALAVRAEDEREYREAHAEPVAAPAPQAPAAVFETTAPSFETAPPVEVSTPGTMVSPIEPVADAVAWIPPVAETPAWTPPVAEPPPVMFSNTAVESIPFLSESVLAAMDATPAPAIAEPAPSMSAFLDAMLDPAPAPPTAPDVAHMDLSAIVELDDLVVNRGEASADELPHFDEAPATDQPPAPAIHAVPLPIDAFDLEGRTPAPVGKKTRTDVPDMFAEFVSFDELGVLDVPSVALGEIGTFTRGTSGGSLDLDAFAEEFDSQPHPGPANVLDSLELAEDPDISDEVDFQPEPRGRDRRSATDVASARTTAALETFFEEDAEAEPVASATDDSALWTPLPMATQQRWPRPEGPTVKSAVLTPAFDAPPDPGVEFAPLPPDRTAKKRKAPKPAQDEWGLFDPAQCGFAALLAKLDEVTDKEEAEQNVG